MFWGLVLEPSKRYTQKVQQSFHISQAALELSTTDLEPVQIVLEYDGANYILATLSKKHNLYQIPLDLNFSTGDQISFRTIGKGRVHLTGYHILEDDLEGMALNGEEESDIEEEKLTDKSGNSLIEKLQTKRKKPDSNENSNSKKSKLSLKNELETNEPSEDESDEDASGEDLNSDSEDDIMDLDEEDEDEDDEEEEEEDEDDEDDDEDEEDVTEVKKKESAPKLKHNTSNVSMNGKSPKNKKVPDTAKITPKSAKKNSMVGKDSKENKSPKSEKKSPKGEKKQDLKSQEGAAQKKVLEGGVVIEELKLGEGQTAKFGKMVQVYYVGRLQNNKKQFDSTTQGPGFKFRLGKGEVIKGWDIGVNGMKVGGKRRITIPSQLAYGAKGSPPAIPPNSALIFDVELKGVH